MHRPDFLIIEPCDFVGFPTGGQLTTAKQLMRVFGPSVGLVGFTSDESIPTGQWIERDFSGQRHAFFAYGRRQRSAAKPLIPGRLNAYAQLLGCKLAMLSIGRLPVFVQAFEALLAVANWGLPSICYRFPGVANCLSHSRYRYARPLAPLLDLAMFRALQRVDVILASAESGAIEELTNRSKGRLPPDRVIQSPTRVDTDFFASESAGECRNLLGIAPDGPLFVTSGRIGRFKGWSFLLDAFSIVLQRFPQARLCFVGDGEDGESLRREIVTRRLDGSVSVTGFVSPKAVAQWLGASDVYVSGSLLEGWSLAMLEALACGKPLVTTEVSGARAMVVEGTNGFVLGKRDPGLFAAAMESALNLPAARPASLEIAERHALKYMGRDLLAVWPALRARIEGPTASLPIPLEQLQPGPASDRQILSKDAG